VTRLPGALDRYQWSFDAAALFSDQRHALKRELRSDLPPHRILLALHVGAAGILGQESLPVRGAKLGSGQRLLHALVNSADPLRAVQGTACRRPSSPAMVLQRDAPGAGDVVPGTSVQTSDVTMPT
jgi:hypothetical protein